MDQQRGDVEMERLERQTRENSIKQVAALLQVIMIITVVFLSQKLQAYQSVTSMSQ